VPIRLPRPIVMVLAAVALVPIAPGAAMDAKGSVLPSAATARSAAPTAPGRVLLITGDRLLAGTGGLSGRGAAALNAGGAVIPGGRVGGSLLSLRAGGHTYAIPAVALPYLGHGLAAGLFDVAALARAESGGRLAVQVSYHGHRPVLPGIRFTGPGSGYLTAASARAFGGALDRQYQADRARGSYGTDGMFGGGVSITLAGAGPSSRAAASPHGYQMRTLTVAGTDLAGKPDTGDSVFVWNVDNGLRSDPNQAFSAFYHGVARFSVAAGHYWAVGIFGDAAFGATAPVRLDVLPQFTVSADTTVHLAARAADSKVTMVTPRPAVAQSSNLYLVRMLRSGPESVLQFSNFHSSIWVSPDFHRTTVGWIRADASQELLSKPGPGTPYGYALSYAGPRGVITSQRYLVHPASLATIRENYYQDVTSPGYWAIFGSFPATFNGYTEPEIYSAGLPGRRTMYLDGPADWGGYYEATGPASGNAAFEEFRAVRPGEHLRDDWNRYPLHPAPTVDLAPRNELIAYLPSADRAGNKLTLDMVPFGGNQPGQQNSYGFAAPQGATVTGSYQVDENGRKIASGNAVAAAHGGPEFYTRVPLASKPAVIRFMLATARTGPAFRLSTATRTVWTWRSAPRPGATLPPDWYCYNPASPVAPLPRHCAVQPMITLRYLVAGLALNGAAPAGRQVLTIAATHLPLAKEPAITAAGLQVSFDGGKTWRSAPVTGTGPGRFRADFTAPAGVLVTLRASARDAAGGSVTETITDGYATAGASSATMRG
jgi:hypothetical protein